VTLWGGRFESEPDRILWDYTVTDVDRRLLAEDIRGSIAHVGMLGDVGLIPLADVGTMTDGLSRILEEAERGEFAFLDTDEDVHAAVERRSKSSAISDGPSTPAAPATIRSPSTSGSTCVGQARIADSN
jgi:argininosuccinate lyase